MTWVKPVAPDKAGPELRQCYEAVHALYPPAYAVEVPAVQCPDGKFRQALEQRRQRYVPAVRSDQAVCVGLRQARAKAAAHSRPNIGGGSGRRWSR
jgi:hypothetical protein